jgi:acyl-CoA thioesterase I
MGELFVRLIGLAHFPTLKISVFTFSLLLGFSSVSNSAHAETVFAVGASNAAGDGVGSAQAWPAQLERMLRARGYDATVVVSAISGDTSSGILGRIDSAMPSGTRVVVFDTGIVNDRRLGVSPSQTAANIAQMRSHVRARGAVAVVTNYAGNSIQSDGIHSTAAGHAAIAGNVVSQVAAALHKR